MTKAQDRARERRRHEKHEQKLAQREAQHVRDKQAVIAVVGVLVVVFGFVWLANVLTNRTDTTPEPASTSQALPT
ncbi:MAG: peptidylprolyl isomerase, partial [Actinomycetota bacterium]|nr:peptidylprolyl isomerase [Actinomycetota bacterium]